MSQEDVRSIHSGSSDQHADDGLDPDQDQDPECQSHSSFGHDSVVLEHIATLPIDMFEPRHFKGRFTKILRGRFCQCCRIIAPELLDPL